MSKLPKEFQFIDLSDYGRPIAKMIANSLKNTSFTLPKAETLAGQQELIEALNKYLLKNIKVNFTFLNIVNKKNLQERLKQRKSLNRYDKFKMSFYNKVQNGFLKLSKR